MRPQLLLLIGLAGAVGALTRYLVAGWVSTRASESFPWGTLAVNMIGCFLFGFIFSLAEERMLISAQTRTIVLTGFMGSLTTFSTFAFESSQLLNDGEWMLLAANLAGSVALGIVLVVVGLVVGRLV